MKRIFLFILTCLATLILFTTVAHSAEPQMPTAVSPDPSIAPSSIVIVKPALFEAKTDVFLVNVMIDLLASEVVYGLNESTSIVLAYSPFADQQREADIYNSTSNFSVGLKLSF